MYGSFIKPLLDRVGALVLLIIFSPIMLLCAVFIKIKLGSPIIFSQPRPGKNGRVFFVYKFRTMSDERDKNGELLPDAKRLGSFGKFLRSCSLDELPQLFNILKGDMSFIGPRPLLVEYLPLYNATQARRHEVMPGITGWAQVNGRNAISWQQKFDLDVYYVDNLSFCLDCKIALLTIKKVFKRDGITDAHSVSAEKFKGN